LARLIEALAQVKELSLTLCVLGGGSLHDDLERLARERGVTVDFRGVVPHGQLPRYFQSADCFVLPSLTEGNPKVLIEAMACGLPPRARVVAGESSLLRATRIRAKGFQVVVAQSEALPFEPDVFDLVSFMEVIEHTQSPAESLDETARVLRPGGRLALTTPN